MTYCTFHPCAASARLVPSGCKRRLQGAGHARVTDATAGTGKHGLDVPCHAHNQAGQETARAKTGMRCFDYNLRKPRLLPAELAAQVRSYFR